MNRPLFYCRNYDGGCTNTLRGNPNAKPLELKNEYHSAWDLQCPVCRGHQIFTKDLVGGTRGQGRRDDMTGTTTSKGGSRYRSGVNF